MTIGPAVATGEPKYPLSANVITRSSAEKEAFKETIAGGLAGSGPLPPGAVRLQISFTVGPSRNWLNLWKSTIDALGPILGDELPGRRWRPDDGRITELALHTKTDPAARLGGARRHRRGTVSHT